MIAHATSTVVTKPTGKLWFSTPVILIHAHIATVPGISYVITALGRTKQATFWKSFFLHFLPRVFQGLPFPFLAKKNYFLARCTDLSPTLCASLSASSSESSCHLRLSATAGRHTPMSFGELDHVLADVTCDLSLFLSLYSN